MGSFFWVWLSNGSQTIFFYLCIYLLETMAHYKMGFVTSSFLKSLPTQIVHFLNVNGTTFKVIYFF